MEKKGNRGVMLVISVLLHSLLAFLPWQEKSRPLPVSSTPTSPIPIVDASKLPAVESQPLPVVPPSPPVADVPIPETIDSPAPAPEVVPEVAPEVALPLDVFIPEAIDNLDPAPQPALNDDPTSVTPAEEEAKFAADLDHLVGYLNDQDKGFGFTLFEIFDLFGESAEQVNQFFDEDGQPKLDVVSFVHFPEQIPEQVVQTVVMPELASNTGFAPQLQETFSAGLAYQLLQGEMLRYLIIVKLNEGSGSVLMLSESLPGLEL